MRERMRTLQSGTYVYEDYLEYYDEGHFDPVLIRLAPALAAEHALEADRLVELLGRHPAPLRAWVKLDERAPADALPLDEFGRRVLGVSPGERVRLRKLETVIAPGERRAAQR
jgi:hypothetical protein